MCIPNIRIYDFIQITDECVHFPNFSKQIVSKYPHITTYVQLIKEFNATLE